MYFFLILISFLKTFNPYFRKHILNSLESYEYLILNTLIVFLFVLLFYFSIFLYDNKSYDKLIDKIHNLTLLQVIYFILIAFITVSSSIFFIHMDKYYNTPLLNTLLSLFSSLSFFFC
jgi:hypothetical protein